MTMAMQGNRGAWTRSCLTTALLVGVAACGESGGNPEAPAGGGAGATGGSAAGSLSAGSGGASGRAGASGSAGAGQGGAAGVAGGVGGNGGGGASGRGAAGGSGGVSGASGAGAAGQSGTWGNTTSCAETLLDALSDVPAGTLVDARDGRTYRTVQIGDQLWMAENLDYGARVDGATGQVDDAVVERYCVDDCDEACAALGGLYTWAEAHALPTACNDDSCAEDLTDPEPGICPDGWHLPSGDEWDVLEATVEAVVGQYFAGRALRSEEGWLDDPVLGGNGNGTDDYDFRVVPAGLYSAAYSAFGALGERAYFWIFSAAPGGVATGRIFGNGQRSITSDSVTKVQGASVRCIAD
jgi:uncharacterized protein (TIGR02145 family)